MPRENIVFERGDLRRSKNPALQIDAKRCIPTTYRGPDGLKAFFDEGS